MSVAERLIVGQRASQTALTDSTTRFVERLWRDLFDPKDIAGSWRKLEPLLVGVIQQRQPVSAALAGDFLTAFRASLKVGGRYVPTLAPLPTADDVVPWLQASGRSTAFDVFDSGRIEQVSDLALDSVTGSVTRMVLDGGRDTVIANTDRDPKCIGYERAASASCCAFCAMLTGRIYRTAETAGEGRDWHRKCSCTAVPVYSLDQTPPPHTGIYGELWSESTRGLSGNDARNAFRRAIEGRTAP